MTRLSELKPQPRNARKHGRRNIESIVAALREVGAARSIVIDENGVVLAGNATIDAAAKAGLTKVEVVEADGQTIIAVRRRGLSAEQKERLALFDNRASELADGWDVAVLRDLVGLGVRLEGLWTEEELVELLGAVREPAGLTDPDAIPEARATDIQPGDLFELGAHRIICGDSTDAAVVARLLAGEVPLLMVTDPPYGVNYDPAWRARAGINNNRAKLGRVSNDDRADWTEVWQLFPGEIGYVWHAALQAPTVQASLEKAEFEMRAQIVWAKDRMVLSRGDYHWQHETCLYGVRAGGRGRRSKDRAQTTVWRIATPEPWLVDGKWAPETSTVWEIPARDDSGHGHGTQKPVECMARPMRNHLAAQVFEPFSGSGTSIIAGEMLGRAVYASELEPAYVQIAIDRWEAYTGRRAAKVGAA